ncbi:FUSC family protein [Cyanobium sp. Morenito 9A2]|uniref:FUSC family protein n=1 Tax=Cyanobium sp. Morenito 9A2 TaxID=2823718 RepID=UPI0020CBDDD0|nr:FUSC family protein [Cyanobium sp. Morenito 9A2]MCP9849018.1 FUSC family protein [Cyanobium sp. Morenito 9A2]
MTLFRREELRLAVVCGLCAGLAALAPIPDGYYMPMAVVAVMAGSYGGSYRLGLQRLQGTLLGAAILLVCQAGLTVPLPLALALALLLTRLLGGLLGLEVGYKVAGFVVVMGWLVHDTNLSSWLPLRLFWTCLGILIGLLALQLFWPSRAIAIRHRACGRLLVQVAAELRQQAGRLDDADPPLEAPMLTPQERRAAHRRDLTALMELRRTLGEAVTELGPNPEAQALLPFWRQLDGCLSLLLGSLDSLRNLRPPLRALPILDRVHRAESELLRAVADRLSLWVEVLPHVRKLDRVVDATGAALASPLAPQLERLRAEEADLFSRPIPELGATRERQIAERLMLCHQAAGAVERMEQRWRELDP